MTAEKPHSKFQHVYAIVRLDMPLDPAEPSNNVAVVKVLASRAKAEKEAARLSQVNAGKTSAYHVYTTRFVR